MIFKSLIKKKLDNYFEEKISKHIEFQNSLENWFYKWLDFQNNSYANQYSPKNTYYEFGTGWGKTLTAFINAAKNYSTDNNTNIEEINICLFDSFQGLPPVKSSEDNHVSWKEGEFAYSKKYISELINRLEFPIKNVKFIEGYYENSLNKESMEIIKKTPPSIITIDTDYYSSTNEVLKFLPMLLKSGTVFYFDDLFSFFLNEDYGQVKSIKEFNKQHIGKLYPLTENNYNGKCFIYSAKKWEHTK